MMEYMNQEEKAAFWKEIADRNEWPETFVNENHLMEYPLPAGADVADYGAGIVAIYADPSLELDIARFYEHKWQSNLQITQGHQDFFDNPMFAANNMDEVKIFFKYLEVAEKNHEAAKLNEFDSDIDYDDSPPLLRKVFFENGQIHGQLYNCPRGSGETYAGSISLDTDDLSFAFEPLSKCNNHFDAELREATDFAKKQMITIAGLAQGIQSGKELDEFVAQGMAPQAQHQSKSKVLDTITKQKLESIIEELQKKGFARKDITKSLTKSAQQAKQAVKPEGR